MEPVTTAALIGLAGSALSGWLGSRNKPKAPPEPPEYQWMKRYGPGIWNRLSEYGGELLDSKEGIPKGILDRMRGTAADEISGGYQNAQRDIDQRSALAGLSGAGGNAARMRYYAGQQEGEQMYRAMSAIDIQDYMAMEDKRQRGANLLFSLTNKSPVYSQIVAQNYWNELQAANENSAMWGNLIGGATSNFMSYYLDKDLMNQYEMNQSNSRTQFQNPYNFNPYYQGGSGAPRYDTRTPADVLGRPPAGGING